MDCSLAAMKQYLLHLKRFLVGSLFLFLTFSHLYAQHFDWAKSISGPGLDVGRAVTTDIEGNVIVVGSFTGSAQLGNTHLSGQGGIEGFVAKYTAAGVLLWARVISGPAEDLARGVTTDQSGHVYVVGHFTDTVVFDSAPNHTIAAKSEGKKDMFVVKYDANGTVLWQLTGGGTGDDTATDIAWYKYSNKLYISGGFENRAHFGTTTILSNGLTDAYLLKIDAAGNAHWIRNGGGLEHDIAASVAVSNTEDVFITGDFYDQAQFEGTTLQATGSSDMFLARFNPEGTLLWATTNGGTSVDVATAVRTDLNGHVFVCGYYQGTTTFQNFSASALGYNDVFLAKFDGNGTCIWLNTAGSSGLDNCLGMAVDWDGSTYLTGFFEDQMHSQDISFQGQGYDIFILSYYPDGTVRYGRNAGAASSDFGTAICLGPQQSLYVTGYYFYFADFDNITIGNADYGDGFIARMSGILNLPQEQERWSNCITYQPSNNTINLLCSNLAGTWTLTNMLGQQIASGSSAPHISVPPLRGMYVFTLYTSTGTFSQRLWGNF